MHSSPLAAALLMIALMNALGGCTTTPVAPMPPPLRENQGWSSPQGSAPGAFLGLHTRENLGSGFDAFDFPPGVRVVRVTENSPAAATGFLVDDVLLSIDGQPTDDPGTVEALVKAAEEGDVAVLQVQRGDQVFELSVALGAAQSSPAVNSEPKIVCRLDATRSRAGWFTVSGGVALVQSHPEAPFPRAGVAVGSVVHTLDGKIVHSDLSLVRTLQEYEPGTRVTVVFSAPGGKRETRVVTLQDQERRITRFSFPILVGYSSNVEGTETSFTLIDLWFLSLFRYERQENERHWKFLSFIHFASGIGDLSE